MNPFKKFAGNLASLFPVNLLLKISGIRTLLPYHHVVSDERLPHIEELYSYKNKKEFIHDLDWLLKHFKPVHPEDAATAVFNGQPLPSKSFLLSFDDGFREVNDVIAPILFQKGVPAIFFINPAFIDNKELFYRCKLGLVLTKIKRDPSLLQKISAAVKADSSAYDEVRKKLLSIHYPERNKADRLGQLCEINFDDFLQKQKPFLTSEQIGKLSSQGFVFGGHSMDHPHYRLLSLEEQLEQTLSSLRFVQQFQNNSFRYFAFPHEDKQVSGEFFQILRNQDPHCLPFGLQNQKKEEHFILHRFNAERRKEKISRTVKTLLLYHSLRRLVGGQHIRREALASGKKVDL